MNDAEVTRRAYVQHPGVAAGLALAALLVPSPVRSQTPAGDDALPCAITAPVDRTLDVCAPDARAAESAKVPGRLDRDLPSSGTAWSGLETREPAAILDRIEGSGLYRAEPGGFSMHGTSWTQNVFVLDGFDVTDPRTGGTPLFEPDTRALERIDVRSTLGPVEQGTPGVVLSLVRRETTTAWHGALDVTGTGEGLQAKEPADRAPAIARLGSLLDGGADASGPLGARTRAFVAARYARATRVERGAVAGVEAQWASLIGRLDWQAGLRDTVRLTTAFQSARIPASSRPVSAPAIREAVGALGGQARWTHAGERTTASAFAGAWMASHEPDRPFASALPLVERLLDGPVPEALQPSRSRRSVLGLGAAVERNAARWGALWHTPRLGFSVRRAGLDERPGRSGPIAETVGGVPARVWEWVWPGDDSRRHAVEAAAWAAERLAWGDRLVVEAGLRFESATGRAEGEPQGVSWMSVLPRASARLVLSRAAGFALLGGYSEYAHRLTLEPLAFGDPNAPHADVHRWDDTNGDGLFEPTERGTLVARTGPGSAADGLVTVDPGLKPPRTRELVAGVEAAPGGWRIRLTGVDRREHDLLETVNVGAPLSAYDVRYLADPAGDIVGPQDDQLLPVYDRRPETFGQDRYVLTNPADHTSLHQLVELRVEKAFGPRVSAALGATASRTETAGANRGFRVTENDQGLVGELYDEPNADTHASGRSFFDRAFTIKAAAAWRVPGDWRLGLVARYQDGQPFGRLVIVPDLAQGAEAIPATPRGQIARSWAMDAEGRYVVPSGHRFAYTLTVDARVEKTIRLGRGRLVLAAEAFNLLGQRNEVEEDPTWGPRFRAETATQPPRAFRLGARLEM